MKNLFKIKLSKDGNYDVYHPSIYFSPVVSNILGKSMLSKEIQDDLRTKLKKFGIAANAKFDFTPVGGGCINNAGCLQAGTDKFFLKTNRKGLFPMMFEKELKGLELLRGKSQIFVPEPYFSGNTDFEVYLLTEWIERGIPRANYWSILGESLAEIHRCNGDFFGLDYPNFIGSLEQFNDPSDSWIDFFSEQRVLRPLRMAIDSGLLGREYKSLADQFVLNLSEILEEPEYPALIHGDLWSGNVMATSNGDPSIIDPAVYYGHREIELAFTALFGGFDLDFYESYQEAFPMSPGYEQRFEIYNLYPLLVHANLFGGGYAFSAGKIIRKYS